MNNSLFETLEDRKLFSVSLVGSVLTVTGTNTADTINITKDSTGKLKVDEQQTGSSTHSIHTYSWAQVSKLIVNGLGGNDEIVSQNSMNKPMLVHGGDGNDTMFGGGGNDSLYGDKDDDLMDGRLGDDNMHGGDGRDSVLYIDRPYNATVTLDNVANDGGPGGHDNVHSDIEYVYDRTGTIVSTAGGRHRAQPRR